MAKVKLTEEQKEYNVKIRAYKSKIKRYLKTNGLRSGQILLEFWEGPLPKKTNLEEIDLAEDVIITVISEKVAEYKLELEVAKQYRS